MKEVQIKSNWQVFVKQVDQRFKIGLIEKYRLYANSEREIIIYFGIKVIETKKEILDEFISSAKEEHQHIIASILYRLYSCGYLAIKDIKYPRYRDWKRENPQYTLDHKLPIRWFPQYTFDCANWQALTAQQNSQKKDQFLEQGIEKIDTLIQEIDQIMAKYMTH